MAQEIGNSNLLEVWAASGAVVEPDISKIEEGWQLGEQPPHEFMNWLQNTFGAKLNHILSNGAPEWNSTTSFTAGSLAKRTGNVWIAMQPNANSEPSDGNVNWSRLLKLADIVNDLVSTDTDKALSAAQGKLLQDNKFEKADVVDNLTTDDATKALSAAQGKILKDSSDDAFELIAATSSFFKSNPMMPAWKKVSESVIAVSQTIYIGVGLNTFKFDDNDPIALTAPVAGTDYAIWCTTTGDLVADESFSTPPSVGAVMVGGFHFAPGGNAPLDPNGNWANHNGGDTTPQINEYSLYDLKWKSDGLDHRGLTLVNNSFWTGIYHLAQNHLNGAVHRNNTPIAKDGQNPQNPYGNGTQYYSDSNWWNIGEALAYHGFRMPTMSEFQLYAIGVKEGASRGNDPVTSGIGTTNVGSSNPDERFTSHWGVIQATGVVSQWSLDQTISSTDQTTSGLQGRGGRNRYTLAAYLGRAWEAASEPGSRASASDVPWLSSTRISSRGLRDHVILV